MRTRLCRWSIIVIAVVSVAWGLVWTARNVLALRAAESLIGELRAAGLPARLEDLRPPQSAPPEENAAPLYEAAHALYQTVAAPEGTFAAVTGPLPWLTPEDRRLLPSYEEALGLAHRAARLPVCDHDLRFEEGFSMHVPHLLGFRQLSSVLSARALARAEDGRMEDAIEDIRAVFGMSRALRHEPLLVSQLVRAALSERALLVLEAVLPLAPSAGEALRRADADALAGALAVGLRSEIVNVLSLADGDALARYRAAPGAPPELRPGFLELPAYRASAVACARLLVRLAGAAGTCREVLREAEAVAGEAEGIGTFQSWVESCAASAGSLAKVESKLRLARLAALFLDWRRTSGAYPESVEAVAGGPDLLDPLTGGPYALRREGEGLVLYSLWPGPRPPPRPADQLPPLPETWTVEWRLPAEG